MKPHAINWTEATWNPFVGCSKVSPGCENCYAIRMAYRLAHIPTTAAIYAKVVMKTSGGKLNWTGAIQENYPQMDKPLRTKKSTIFFVDSMSDLFHENLLDEQIDAVFQVMSDCQRHIFQVLTKRPHRMLDYFAWKHRGNGISFDDWPLKNVWLGTSVENQKYADERIPLLLQCPAEKHFLSCEPLLGPLSLDNIKVDFERLSNFSFKGKKLPSSLVIKEFNCLGEEEDSEYIIDWVIVGGESGPNSRPMHPDWVRSIRDQCAKANVPFVFKQWGEWYTRWMDIKREGDYPHRFMMFHTFHQWVNKAASWLNKGDVCISIDGTICKIGKDFMECQYPVAIMNRVGKHASGNLLDGKTHLEIPGN